MAPKTQKKTRSRKKKPQVEPLSRGQKPLQAAKGTPTARIEALGKAIEADGGAVLASYKDPLGGHWQILAVLPIDRVEPTPYQRDLSPAHVQRLGERIDQLDRFLDPITAYRTSQGVYWTPNGHHRAAAMKALGARSITALVLPDEEIAYKILALNTEKAHNVREKSLEVIRMARALAELDPRPEKEFHVEFEDPAFLTLGLCYEKRGRFSGGAYQAVLRRIDAFLASALPKALAIREERSERLLELDDAVQEAVKQLKERGFESPYLKAFVVARVNPIRFQRKAKPGYDEALETMLASARKLDVAKVKSDQVARASGPTEE